VVLAGAEWSARVTLDKELFRETQPMGGEHSGAV
jgi:hypothetical protein